MQPPITSTYQEVFVKSANGQHYRLTPNGKRYLPTAPGELPRFIYTFQYRRCDEQGSITPRVRQSKKNRLRARRA
jgi:hypothetical protein